MPFNKPFNFANDEKQINSNGKENLNGNTYRNSNVNSNEL